MPILPGKPPKAKLIAALMAGDEQIIAEALSALEPVFGRVQLKSNFFSFKYSDYYKSEMGDSLLKVFCSFDKLIEPNQIVDLKLNALEIEKKFLISPSEGAPHRTVNIDPGYLDRMKLFLATTKDSCHRIYLGEGIYGDIELMYKSASFVTLEWTYPDYREPFAIQFFNSVRSNYLAELRDSGQKKEKSAGS